MLILILQHEIETTAGSTPEWLKAHGISYQTLLTPEVSNYPTLSEFDALIVLGGSMNVDEEVTHPWLKIEKAFIRQCLSGNKKILGLCLGSQLLAEVLGGQVQSMNKWEIGWFDVESNNTRVPAFHWHQYNFSIPESCTRIASSQACPNQGFTYKDQVLAFQFHPEVDAEWLQLALKDYKPVYKGAVQSKEEILQKNETQLPLTRQWYFQQLKNFFQG